MSENLLTAWNGLMISIGMGTIGALCVVLPVIILSLISSRQKDDSRDDSRD